MEVGKADPIVDIIMLRTGEVDHFLKNINLVYISYGVYGCNSWNYLHLATIFIL